MPTTVLIRPDGSTLRVNDADVPALTSLGYKEQTPEGALHEGETQAAQDFYSTPGQKAATLVQGGMSGASFGLSDLLMNDTETQERAKYNPGYRIGGELLGGFVAPVGPIGDAAEAVGAGRFVKGAAEGAAFGAGGAITQSQLTGDPLTAQSIIAGAGWGSLFGGGLNSALGAGADRLENVADRVGTRGEALRAPGEELIENQTRADYERAVADAKMSNAVTEGMSDYEAKRAAVVEGLGDRHYREFKASMDDARAEVGRALDTAGQVTEDQVGPNFSDLKASKNNLYNWLLEPAAAAPEVAAKEGGSLASRAVEVDPAAVEGAGKPRISQVRPTAKAAEDSLRLAQKAGHDGNYEKMSKYLEQYKSHVSEMAAHFGGDMPSPLNEVNELLAFSKARFTRSAQAADTVASMSAIANELKGLPADTEGFMRMTSAKMERLSGALDALQDVKAAEFAGVKQSVTSSLESLSERLGLQVQGGTPGSMLREIQSTLKDVGKAKTLTEIGDMAAGKKAWVADTAKAEYDAARAPRMPPKPAPKLGLGGRALATVGGVLAEEAAKGLGLHDTFLRYGVYHEAKHTIAALLGTKAMVLGHIAEAVRTWAPRGAKALRAIPAARIEPLARRITGELDEGKHDKIALMERRSAEIRAAAPVVRDVLYRNVGPLSVEHPELASAMHEMAAQQFAFLLNKLPQDPGGAFNKLQTLWRPSPAEVAKFERYYAVFHDPVGEIQRALKTGNITPELTEALQEMSPELYTEMKTDLLMRITEPATWSKLSYNEQVNMGMLLGFPVHSTMRPKFIAAQSAMYRERNDPQTLRPQAGAQSMGGGGGGRPPGPGDGSTQAQRTTEH